MKVLIITENLGRGGAERVLSYLSQQSQLDVEYVFLSLTPIVKYRFNSRIYVIGRGVLSINLPMLYRVLLHEKPDVVMGSTHLGRYMTILCLGRKKVTRLGIHPDAVLKGSLGPLNWLLHLLAIGISKRVITPSVEIKQALTNRWKIPPSKVVVIRNPVDVEKVSVMAEEPLDSRDSQLFSENLPVILSVGRLHRSKGHWHLIRIFKKVNQQIPESRLVLVGDGPFAMYLVGLASRLELQNKVFFLDGDRTPSNTCPEVVFSVFRLFLKISQMSFWRPYRVVYLSCQVIA
ncbi:MAG: glycosyltransferase [Candidatus Caldarchaeum sp.]|nr:glycosyltransferase [Candidatus Caldarchaeum sp.]